jgi:hypothetical protein
MKFDETLLASGKEAMIRQHQQSCRQRVRKGALRRSINCWLLACSAWLGAGRPRLCYPRTSSPIFYIDTSVTPTLRAYVAYQINNNSGVNYPMCGCASTVSAAAWLTSGRRRTACIILVRRAGPNEDGVLLCPGQCCHGNAPVAHDSDLPDAAAHQRTAKPELQHDGRRDHSSQSERGDYGARRTEPPQLGGLVSVTVQGSSGTIGDSRIWPSIPPPT